MADISENGEEGLETSPATDVVESDEPTSQNVTSAQAQDGVSPDHVPEDETAARSIKCDDCGKLFQDVSEAEFHGMKSGHQNFSESTDDVQPLSDEEKQLQLKRLEERIAERRRERLEKEKAETVEREKQRRVQGKDMAALKQRLQYEEMKKLADERKREKQADRALRQHIKRQIQQDRIDREIRMGGNPPPPSTQPTANTASSTTSGQRTSNQSSDATPAKKQYDSCRLQLRLPDGGVLTETFNANEQLAAVRLFVQQKWGDATPTTAPTDPGAIKLMTSFPKLVYTEDHMMKSLKELDLLPSAVIIVTKN